MYYTMNKTFLHILLFVMLMACSSPGQKKTASDTGISSFAAVSKTIIETAKSQLGSELKNPVFSLGNNGAIIIRSEEAEFFIEPSDINIGQLDEDNSEDGIVSCSVTEKGKVPYRKHLILLNKGQVKVVREFVADMNVMQISRRIVYAEIPKHGSNSPLHNCHVCKDNVMYKLSGDSLLLVK